MEDCCAGSCQPQFFGGAKQPAANIRIRHEAPNACHLSRDWFKNPRQVNRGKACLFIGSTNVSSRRGLPAKLPASFRGSSAKSVFADKDPMSAVCLRFFLYQHVYISNTGRIAIEVILIKRLRRVPRAGVLSACAKLFPDEFPIVLPQVKALRFLLNPPR